MLNLRDESILFNSSDDEEDDEEQDYEDINSDFNSNNSTSEKMMNCIEKQSEGADKDTKDKMYEKNSLNNCNNDQKSLKKKSLTSNTRKKLVKLAKRTNKSRLIKSMQNLLTYDRSRSNSNENLNNDSDINRQANKKLRNSSEDNNPKPEIIKSFFVSIMTFS